MNKTALRIAAILMSLLMIVGLAACGGGGDASSTPATSESTVEGTTTTAGDDDTTTAADDTTTAADDTTTAADDTTTKKDDGKTTTTTKKDDGKTTTTTKRKTPTKMKTWAEVKKGIPANASGKTLTVYGWNAITEVYGMDKVTDSFTKETGIKIDFQHIPYDQYFSKISAAVSAQNAPDAVHIQNANPRKELSNLQPLNTATSFDFNDKAWDQDILDIYTFGNNLYGVNMVNTPRYSPYVMYYNKSLIKDYGLDDPYDIWKKDKNWNWDTVEEMCEDFLDQVKDDSYSGFTTMAGFEYWWSAGKPPITFNTKTRTYSHNLQDKTFIQLCQKYVKMAENGTIQDKMLSNLAKFNNGKILFCITTGLHTSRGSSQLKTLRDKGNLGCVPLPSFKKGVADVQVLNEALAWGIPKTAKNAELVPYYLRYMLDRTNYDMDNYYNCDHGEEVLKYIQSKGAKMDYAGHIMTMDQANTNTNSFIDNLRGSGYEMIQRVLDALQPGIEASITDMNDYIKTL